MSNTRPSTRNAAQAAKSAPAKALRSTKSAEKPAARTAGKTTTARKR